MTSKATTNGTTPATTTNAQSDQAMRESQGAARFEEELNVFLSGPGMLLQNQEVRDQLKTYIGAPDRVGGGEWTTWVKLGEGYMRIGLRSLLSQRLRGSPVLPIVEGILTSPKVMRAIEEGVSSDLPLGSLSVLFRDHAVNRDISSLPALADAVFGRMVAPLHDMFIVTDETQL